MSDGYVHPPKYNPRLEINKILDQYQHIRDSRDLYSDKVRSHNLDTIVNRRGYEEQQANTLREKIEQLN